MNTPDKQSIDKTLNNTATHEEARHVIRWFSTPEGNAYLGSLMDKDVERIQPGTENLYTEQTIPSDEMYQYIMSRIRWQRKRRIFSRAAAILIPFILFASQLWYIDKRIDLFANSDYEEIYVPKGEHLQLVFQDGSRVTLNAESHIKYPQKFGFSERKVELTGEAFFEVSSNKKRPFIVDLNGINVKVLGTTFNVKAYPSDTDISVSLESGMITLETFSKIFSHLKPGENAIYNRLTKTCKISTPRQIANLSAWKNNLIIFDNAPLSEVMKTLSRQFNVTFSIADSTALNYNYTLTSRQKQIHTILEDLEKIAPVYFTEENNSIVVSKKKQSKL